MAGSRAAKARTKNVSPRRASQRGNPREIAPEAGLKELVAALERERDALRAELERSAARVRTLEKAQAQVRDRIAWALDTLHNLIEGKG